MVLPKKHLGGNVFSARIMFTGIFSFFLFFSFFQSRTNYTLIGKWLGLRTFTRQTVGSHDLDNSSVTKISQENLLAFFHSNCMS